MAALMPLLKRRIKLQCMLVFVYAVLLGVGALSFVATKTSFTPFLAVDELNTLFIAIMAVILLAVTIYGFDFFRRPEEQKQANRIWVYHLFLLLFVTSMLGILLSAHIGMLWVFIETSTLTSTMLICYHRSRQSYEAAWKYIFICSLGISFAFIGIVFLSLSAVGLDNSLSWTWLNANAGKLDSLWLKLSMPFLLLGIGTKMGLAPMHNWLPDAHSEAPSPISAALSATLLNAALLGILRVHKILINANLQEYSGRILIVMGFLSLFIPAVFIIRARNYKRMLAYSSVENMGIIAIGVGIGGPALFAALLHMIGHSLVKAAFFLTAGNIYSIYHSKRIRDIRGLLRADPLSGWLWLGGAVGICAFPPFVTFVSEFRLITTMMDNGAYVATGLFCLLLTIILGGMFKQIMVVISGPVSSDVGDGVSMLGPCGYLPQVLLLIAALALGLYLPEPVSDLLDSAVKFIGGMTL